MWLNLTVKADGNHVTWHLRSLNVEGPRHGGLYRWERRGSTTLPAEYEFTTKEALRTALKDLLSRLGDADDGRG